jgi:hypothetical protein
VSDETPSPFNPDPFDEMIDKESRSDFQKAHDSDRKPPTERTPIIGASDETIFYAERRHFKAFFKRLWWPKTFGIGAALIITFWVLAALPQNESQVIGTTCLVLVAYICFVYPIMRTHFWWRRRIIQVSVRKGQAIITLYEPRSRFYGFKGDDEGVNFLLSGNVAIMLNQKTWAELYIFRKSAGGMVDTILDQDKVLHNLMDIYRPDLLKQAIEDAMDTARGV